MSDSNEIPIIINEVLNNSIRLGELAQLKDDEDAKSEFIELFSKTHHVSANNWMSDPEISELMSYMNSGLILIHKFTPNEEDIIASNMKSVISGCRSLFYHTDDEVGSEWIIVVDPEVHDLTSVMGVDFGEAIEL